VRAVLLAGLFFLVIVVGLGLIIAVAGIIRRLWQLQHGPRRGE